LPRFASGKILTRDNEYSSNAYVWHRLAKASGLSLETCAWAADGSLDTAKLCDAIEAQTKIVTVSWVQNQTGAETDLAMLSATCKKVGDWLVVDAIQGAGAKALTGIGLENVWQQIVEQKTRICEQMLSGP
jgi:selenocysteine lyase/cysteine desulfurase